MIDFIFVIKCYQTIYFFELLLFSACIRQSFFNLELFLLFAGEPRVTISSVGRPREQFDRFRQRPRVPRSTQSEIS
jgi:hypothetical protein